MNARRPRRVVRTLGASLIGLLLAALVAEAGLRLTGAVPFRAWSPRGMHRADPELGIEPQPGFVGRQETDEFSVEVRIDSAGMRVGKTELAAPASERPVVLLLGDSFAFGHGVEAEQSLAGRLQERLGPHLDVRNAGVMSYGTLQEAVRFERLAPSLAPRLCVLVFFAGNDVLDNARPALTVREGFVMNRSEELTLARRLKLAFKYRSALYRLLARRFFPAEIQDRCGTHASFGFDAFRRAPTRATMRAWERTEEALATLADRVRAQDCRLVVACLPTRYQVEPAWWAEHVQQCGFAPDEFDLELVQHRVSATCERLGVPFLDLLPGLRTAPGPLYYRGLLEMHLDPNGHARVAELLGEYLVANDLLP